MKARANAAAGKIVKTMKAVKRVTQSSRLLDERDVGLRAYWTRANVEKATAIPVYVYLPLGSIQTTEDALKKL